MLCGSRPLQLLQRRWAGHSKWHNIRHKKAHNDKRRAAVLEKASKAITIAVRVGGSEDPKENVEL